MMRLEDISTLVYACDEKAQIDSLKRIMYYTRHIRDKKMLSLAVEDAVSNNMFWVPTNDYLLNICGADILNSAYGIYDGEFCRLWYRLAMPMHYFDGTCCGYIGYTDSNDFEPDSPNFIKYLYPPKSILDKSRYLYIEGEEYLKAIQDEYIFIVDGLFDKRRLQSIGLNACSLCGSELTKYHRIYLNLIKYKIVLADNDLAGRKLAEICLKSLTNCIEFRLPVDNDCDEFLKCSNNVKVLKDLFSESKSEGFLLDKVIPYKRGVSCENK